MGKRQPQNQQGACKKQQEEGDICYESAEGQEVAAMVILPFEEEVVTKCLWNVRKNARSLGSVGVSGNMVGKVLHTVHADGSDGSRRHAMKALCSFLP